MNTMIELVCMTTSTKMPNYKILAILKKHHGINAIDAMFLFDDVKNSEFVWGRKSIIRIDDGNADQFAAREFEVVVPADDAIVEIVYDFEFVEYGVEDDCCLDDFAGPAEIAVGALNHHEVVRLQRLPNVFFVLWVPLEDVRTVQRAGLHGVGKLSIATKGEFAIADRGSENHRHGHG
jgi:hypothetical protein